MFQKEDENFSNFAQTHDIFEQVRVDASKEGGCFSRSTINFASFVSTNFKNSQISRLRTNESV